MSTRTTTRYYPGNKAYRELSKRLPSYRERIKTFKGSQEEYEEKVKSWKEKYRPYLQRVGKYGQKIRSGSAYTFVSQRQLPKRTTKKLYGTYTTKRTQLKAKAATLKTKYTKLKKEQKELQTLSSKAQAPYTIKYTTKSTKGGGHYETKELGQTKKWFVSDKGQLAGVEDPIAQESRLATGSDIVTFGALKYYQKKYDESQQSIYIPTPESEIRAGTPTPTWKEQPLARLGHEVKSVGGRAKWWVEQESAVPQIAEDIRQERTFFHRIEKSVGKQLPEKAYLGAVPEESKVGRFLSGAYGGFREKPLQVIGTAVLFRGATQLLGKGTRAAATSAAGLRFTSVTSPALRTGLARGTGALLTGTYGVSVGARAMVSDDPAYKLGEITSTEIIPMAAGAKAGMAAFRREEIKRIGVDIPLSKLSFAERELYLKDIKRAKSIMGRDAPELKEISLSRLKLLEGKPEAQRALEKYLRMEKDIVVGGTISSEAQLPAGVLRKRPGDIDLYTLKGLDPKEAARKAADILKASGVEGITQRGGKVKIRGEKLLEAHTAESYLEPNIQATLGKYSLFEFKSGLKKGIIETPGGTQLLRLDVQAQRKVIGYHLEPAITGKFRKKDKPAFEDIMKGFKGEEIIKVAPETYAKSLVKKGELELVQHYMRPGTKTEGLYGFYRRDKGIVDTLSVAKGLSPAERKITLRHELIHLKTPSKILDIDRVPFTSKRLPYRAEPGEILAFGGEKIPFKFKTKRKYLAPKGFTFKRDMIGKKGLLHPDYQIFGRKGKPLKGSGITLKTGKGTKGDISYTTIKEPNLRYKSLKIPKKSTSIYTPSLKPSKAVPGLYLPMPRKKKDSYLFTKGKGAEYIPTPPTKYTKVKAGGFPALPGFGPGKGSPSLIPPGKKKAPKLTAGLPKRKKKSHLFITPKTKKRKRKYAYAPSLIGMDLPKATSFKTKGLFTGLEVRRKKK